MPRTLIGRNIKTENLVRLIWGAKETNKLTEQELADALGVSRNTLRQYKKHPEELKLIHIINACRNLHIPIEDMRQTAIKF